MKLQELLQRYKTDTRHIRVFNQDLTPVQSKFNLDAEILRVEENNSEYCSDVFIVAASFDEDELAKYVSSIYEIPFEKTLETKIFNQGTVKSIEIDCEYKDYSLIIFINLTKQTISYRIYDNASFIEQKVFNYRMPSQTTQNYREGGVINSTDYSIYRSGSTALFDLIGKDIYIIASSLSGAYPNPIKRKITSITADKLIKSGTIDYSYDQEFEIKHLGHTIFLTEQEAISAIENINSK